MYCNHRMPVVKKTKLEKVIKSIDKKKDILVLECEWESCDFICNDNDSFLIHISRHIDALVEVVEPLTYDSATNSIHDTDQGEHR